ncbi:MAG TPA: TIGR02117 family protein [Sphingomicrobium sp.]|nr:TIGR02117 family protein [Sphingomicrobium sp.]
MANSSASLECAEGRPDWRSAIGRATWWLAATLVTIALAYFAAALAGALIPRNAGWQEPDQGVTFYIWDNGVHVDLVLPAEAAGVNLHELASPDHVEGAVDAPQWVALGWGQREFYLETPTWGDLTPRNALRAVTGGDSLMRVSHHERRPSGDGVREIRVDPDGYRRMVAFAAESFDRGGDGEPILLDGRAHQANDAFYEAVGGYNAFRTSNQWTADGLAEAGVRIGLWTPLSIGMMWRYRRAGGG